MLVQKLRLQRGWSQEQLAEVSGLSVRTVQRIERGQPASLETLKALASVFEIDFADLQTQDPPMPIAATNSREAEEALAFARVRDIKRFYLHVLQYIVVIATLAVINLLSSPRHIWFVWPALGWGVWLLFHGLRVYDRIPFLNADWEKREVEKILGRRL